MVTEPITEADLFRAYAPDPATVEDRVLASAIRARIRELWAYRTWYRQHGWTLDWPSRRENDDELRALVRLARNARRQAQPVLDRMDPMTLAAHRGDHFRYPGVEQ